MNFTWCWNGGYRQRMSKKVAELAKEWHWVPVMPTILCGLGLLYTTYYFVFVAKKPQLIGKDKRFLKFLSRHCPALSEKYWPLFWCFGARANTIVRALFKGHVSVAYRRERIETHDGGEICLDWMDNDDSERDDDSGRRPTVILLPGLTGDSQDNYMLHIVEGIRRLGYRAVVFNYRGNGGAELKTPRTYCAANTDDLQFVVDHVKGHYPDSPLIGVGLSLGGMILFHYVANSGKDCKLQAAMVISTVWNVFKTTESLESPMNYLVFNLFLTSSLNKLIQKHRNMFEDLLDVDHAMQSRSIRDFDERVTAKIFGYDSVEQYYSDASMDNKLDAIRIPVLCLTAADDPFSPMDALPLGAAQQHPYIVFAVTSHGGHIGFCEGLLPRKRTYMDRVLFQFVDAVFKYGNKELKEKNL
ncbi:phospholipase ABHD3-like [Ptychodera flava]|uniref:phospholipase ABHD3-like n=1 Tax=Ptychodera flava TaxID=63121 RepID=UPI00396A3CDF